jgi:hypothetical protein
MLETLIVGMANIAEGAMMNDAVMARMGVCEVEVGLKYTALAPSVQAIVRATLDVAKRRYPFPTLSAPDYAYLAMGDAPAA